jgi:hypothetical protein
MIMKSPSGLIKIWWPIIIGIPRRWCYFEFFVSDKYFLKANSREDKIFLINNQFCDLYIKNILDRYSEFNSKIVETLFFGISREVIFQLIKIIGEFYYILVKSLARIHISLLIFDLKIEIIIENILEIRYIKFPIDSDILSIIYIFLRFYISAGIPSR